MRHGLGYRKLNKTGEHRKALFKNMLNSLIKYEQIITTLPKAKELKPQIDKVITIGKKNILSNKKRLFSKLQNKQSVTKVFEELSKICSCVAFMTKIGSKMTNNPKLTTIFPSV